MKRLLLALLVSVALTACELECPDCPEPPPCPDCPACDSCCPDCPDCPDCPTCPECDSCCDPCSECPEVECPDGYSPEEQDGKIVCVKDPVVPPPPPVDNCKRFFTLEGVGIPAPGDWKQDCRGATGKLFDLCKQRQEMIWQGSRSPQHAAYHCPDKLDQIFTTQTELNALAEAGESLTREMERFYIRLQIENAECPGRTVVNRQIYKDFQVRRAAHMEHVYSIDDNTQAHACRQEKAYDNMMGWCCRCFGRGPNCQQWIN